MLPLTFKKSILELLSVLSVWLVRYARNLHPWKSNKWNLTLARQASIDSPNWTRARLKFGKYEIWVALGKSSSNSVLAVSSINTDLGNWKIRVIYGSFRVRFFRFFQDYFPDFLSKKVEKKTCALLPQNRKIVFRHETFVELWKTKKRYRWALIRTNIF